MNETGGLEAPILLITMLGVLGLYFLPWLISLKTGNRPVTVFVVNLLTGWTLLGWIVALLLAL